jgi:hypothetical protein
MRLNKTANAPLVDRSEVVEFDNKSSALYRGHEDGLGEKVEVGRGFKN